MQETKDAMSIDAMQKTKTTMNDASECVPPTPCGSHAPSRMCTHAAKRAASLPAKQKPASNVPRAQATATALAIPRADRLTASVFRPQLAADDARSSRHRQDQVVGRLGGGSRRPARMPQS